MITLRPIRPGDYSLRVWQNASQPQWTRIHAKLKASSAVSTHVKVASYRWRDRQDEVLDLLHTRLEERMKLFLCHFEDFILDGQPGHDGHNGGGK